MRLDLDRLHKVVTGEITHRGCGKTVAHCADVAGLIELGEKDIWLRVEKLIDVQHVLQTLREVFGAMGLPEVRTASTYYYVYGETMMRFVTVDSWAYTSGGYPADWPQVTFWRDRY